MLAFAPAAWAKPKVALTAIDGDASGDVHDAVAEALEGGKEVSLISNREVTRAVDKVGDVADLTEKDLKKLSNELEADAIVVGKLEKSGGAKSLKFKIFAHKKMAKGFTVSFKDAKSAKFQAVLHDKLLDKMGIAAGSGGDDAEADAPVAEAKPAKKGKKGKKGKAAAADADADSEAEAKPAKKLAKGDKVAAAEAPAEDEAEAKPAKKKAAAAGAEDDAEAKAKPAKADDAGDEDAPKKKKKVAAADEADGGDAEASVSARAELATGARSTATPAVRLDLGPSVLKHSYKFKANAGGPVGSSLAPTPGVRIDGELYPLGFGGARGGLSGLGLGFDADRTLSLKLTAKNGATTMQTTVKQMNYSIGLRYRLAFGGGTDTSPTLTFGVGYGKRLFSPDKAKLMDAGLKDTITRNTPTTEYTLLDPGATVRYPFTAKIAASLGVRGLIVTNGGPIQANTSYGQAKVYGVEGDLGLDILFTPRIGVRLSGDFDQFGFTFQGKGKLSQDAAGKQIVGGLTDRGIGGAATLAVLY
ncbi:MAG TPA: hypothetical protein VFP84_10110 [Kofleriaceae bacterium]|nr:hypothetical protein [Kofleriaceae bacterium]